MNLVDSSLWIDYFRARTPATLKRRIHEVVQRADVVTCEPILFEMLRSAKASALRRLQDFFATIPVLATPGTLRTDTRGLGRLCAEAGFFPPSMDLLIAQIALHHSVAISTSDDHFTRIAVVSPLQVNQLRPDNLQL